MKKIFLILTLLISIYSIQAQSYERFVEFNATTREVSISKLGSIREDISLEYSIDGRIISTYRLDYRATTISLPSIFSRCEFRFYYTSGGPEARDGDIGIAVVDDIDIKHFDNADYFTNYFSTICNDENFEYFIINNQLITSKCVCEFYTSLEAQKLLDLFLSNSLATYFYDACTKAGIGTTRASSGKLINPVLLEEMIQTNTIKNIALYDLNGKTYPIITNNDIIQLVKGMYIISYNDNGILTYSKFIKE